MTHPIRAPRFVDRLGAITQAAFVLALALVAARCTILESIREPFDVAPGTSSYPLGPGPGTSLALDLLCCLPAILILLRRSLDPSYALRLSLVHALTLLLVLWMALSVTWADDKFTALISSANFLAAMSLLWAASQLVRSWLRLRTVAAICFGLLLVYLVQGFYYKFVELPDLIHTFEQNKQQILQERGFAPDSAAAKQFENKIVSGELIGFNTSANSYAAMIVLLQVVGLGAAIQRRADHDPPASITILLTPVPFAVWLLACTLSKGAMVTLVLALILFWAVHHWRGILATRPRHVFRSVLAAIVLFILAILGLGILKGGLPTSSLNFRWRYWTAAWRMFQRHPLRGVGWANFGPHYLRDRLPAAAEEIRDPHNFIIRFFVELGLIGGLLLLAWLIRLWREMTRPITPPPPAARIGKTTSRAAVGILCGIAALSMAINIIAGMDFSQDPSFISLEIMKRCLYLCALAIGALLVGLRSLQDPRSDDRPAPWILYALLISLALFLLHNLIEFSLFEPGPLCLFAFLAGSALGVRQPVLPTRRSRAPAALALITVAALWITALIFLWLPVSQAESSAEAGDEALRTAHYDIAAADYSQAFTRLPLNADYAFRAGRALQIEADAMQAAGQQSKIPASLRLQIRAFYTTAISHDPSSISPHLRRAALALQVLDADQVIADFNRALELNPNEVSIRLDYAKALEQLRLPQQAAEQLQLALFFNHMLDPAEPKRLTPAQIQAIQKELSLLNTSGSG
jgi:O-antigen ligase/tetratricopeptide (TPR) repeat protein